MRPLPALAILLLPLLTVFHTHAQPLDPKMHHLRHGLLREWDEFPEHAEASQLRLTFTARANDAERTLRLRHRDLHHPWAVHVNGKEIARLPPEDNATGS